MASSPLELTVWVAPKVLARPSLKSSMSTATIMRAPATAAPWIADSPTPPEPNTTTTDPGATRAVLVAAQKPVITPQPTSAAERSGASAAILIRLRVSSVAYSAITPQPEKMPSGWPWASVVRSAPLGRVVRVRAPSSHSAGRPMVQ